MYCDEEGEEKDPVMYDKLLPVRQVYTNCVYFVNKIQQNKLNQMKEAMINTNTNYRI